MAVEMGGEEGMVGTGADEATGAARSPRERFLNEALLF